MNQGSSPEPLPSGSGSLIRCSRQGEVGNKQELGRSLHEKPVFEAFTTTLILHITTRRDWEQAKKVGIYRTQSLEKQGFIRCSYPDQLVRVADAAYAGRRDLVLLCIESNRVRADVHEEGAGDESYPLIFGPLNLDSVAKTLDFEPDKNGRFKLPSSIDPVSRERGPSMTLASSPS